MKTQINFSHALRRLAFPVLLLLALVMAGCGADQQGEEQTSEGGIQSTSFVLDLSSILELDNPPVPAPASTSPAPMATVASGQLMIVPLNNDPLPVFPFEVTLDEGTLTLTTDMRVDLDHGLYFFYILLNLNINGLNSTYAGIAPLAIVEGGDNTVRMTLNPLLVSFGINYVTDLINMTSLVFNFPADIREYTDPRFGISIDGSPEYVFKIDPQKLVSTKVTIYLPYRETPYQIDPRFYDGAVVTEGGVDEYIEVPPPTNPPTEVPVEPITAEVKYSYSTTPTGETSATFYMPIPSDVLTEVADTSGSPLSDRLKLVLSLVSPNNPVSQTVVPLNTSTSGVDSGSVTLTGFTPELVTWALSFYKLDSSGGTQQIAYCANGSYDLKDLAEKTLLCNLLLYNTAISTPHSPASVVVTVTDAINMAPISGAVVTVNGNNVTGITGDGTDGPDGSVEFFLQPGSYNFQATANGLDPSNILPVVLGSGETQVPVPLTIIGPDITPPVPVTGLKATAGDATVILGWTNPGTDFAGVRVIRGAPGDTVSPDSQGQEAWNILSPANALTDNTLTLVNGTTYRYWVFAKDAADNYSPAVYVDASPQATPVPEPPPSSIVLTASRTVRPREYIDGEANLQLAEGETITVAVPRLEDVVLIDGSPDHYLVFVYLGDVKCMYLGGQRDRHLGGIFVDIEEAFHKAFKSPACHSGFRWRSGNDHDDDDDDDGEDHSNHGHHNRGSWQGGYEEGDLVTTEGPIRARVITGHPHHAITTVEITIPVIRRNQP